MSLSLGSSWPQCHILNLKCKMFNNFYFDPKILGLRLHCCCCCNVGCQMGPICICKYSKIHSVSTYSKCSSSDYKCCGSSFLWGCPTKCCAGSLSLSLSLSLCMDVCAPCWWLNICCLLYSFSGLILSWILLEL